jgi:hypothetical protein
MRLDAFDPTETRSGAVDVGLEADRFFLAYYAPFLTALELLGLEVGFSAKRRLLGVLRTSCDPIAGDGLYDQVCRPAVVEGQRAPGLRLDHPVTQALMSALVVLHVSPSYGFCNHDLRELLAQALGLTPDAMTPGKMSYHLRRLRLHGLIERIPGTHRYLVTDLGLRASLFLTRVHRRLLVGGMADVEVPYLHVPSKLRSAFD